MATLSLVSFILTQAAKAAWDPNDDTVCQFLTMPKLMLHGNGNKDVIMCAPNDGRSYPPHVVVHGDAAYAAFATTYYSVSRQIAAQGFVTLLHESCEFDATCDDGRASFLEVLEVMAFFQSPAGRQIDFSSRIDLKQSWTVSGHSTGGRVALMLAALRDNPAYLQTYAAVSYAPSIMAEHRALLQRLTAVITVHPDGPLIFDLAPFGGSGNMYPEPSHFAVTRMPVLVITGSQDIVEPPHSAWNMFEAMATPDKVYIEVKGETHMSVTTGKGAMKLAPAIALFARAYGLDNRTAAALVVGSGPGSLRTLLPPANGSDPQQGNNHSGFVACRRGHAAIPLSLSKSCEGSLTIVYS